MDMDLFWFWWLPVLAVVLDALMGDPPHWPHPVRAIGALCAAVEPRARVFCSARAAGLAALVCVLAVTWIAVRLVLALPSPLASAIALYLAFAGLAQGQLLREGKKAVALLERGDLAGLRLAVGMLVSRDVSNMDAHELGRSLAETLAENFNDAFIAPLFWLVLGGPEALWLYKAASTMDSMWGYPYEPWTRFGTAAARLDDILAYVPARLAALFLYGAAWMRGAFTASATMREYGMEIGARRSAKSCADFVRFFSVVARDARAMKSPNAGWPMAACAWIHHASMGGPTVYAGLVVDKPLLGPMGQPWTTATLKALCANITLAGGLAGLVLCASGFALHRFIF